MPPQGGARQRALPRWCLAVAPALAAAALAGCGTPSGTPSPRPRLASPAPVAAGQYVTHADRAAGFSIEYPSSWNFLVSSDPRFKEVKLLVGPDTSTYASVRVIPSDVPVPQDAASQLALVQKLVSPVTVVDQSPVDVHGIRGFQVIYPVAGTATPTVHIHIFLFERSRVDTILFETPQSSLATYAAIFDHMRDSFRAIPVTQSPTPQPASPAPPAASPGAGVPPAAGATPSLSPR